MKIRNQRRAEKESPLSVEDHLWLQNAIEKRAYYVWLAGGSREMTGMQDWLQAEREIFEEFLRNRAGPNKNISNA